MGLEITAAGMASSLGDFKNGCAAARAGLSRVSPHSEFNFLDESSADMYPVSVHAAMGDALAGFSGTGRLLRLAHLALEDLLENVAEGLDDLSRTAVIINMGSGYYWDECERQQSVDLDSADGAEPSDIIGLRSDRSDERRKALDTHFIQTLIHVAGVGSEPGHTELCFSDAAGVGEVLNKAERLLDLPGIDRCIIGGVDSLLDGYMMPALIELDVLSSPNNPAGFFAGEAAVFFVVENGAGGMATLSSPLAAMETYDDAPGAVVVGQKLANLLNRLVAVEPVLANVGAVIGSVNGTEKRAMEWGTARIRLPKALANTMDWHPAEHFGETGAAAGFLAIALAQRAKARGYMGGESCLIYQSSPYGQRTAFVLR
ncbi:Uncharacterised protein [BD1-7 clade bacterium]|uniref:Beta-ketoacyl synthase N-terminal domain-containing protein n=1 Tax=BD1-7 clade bacterium TaxID=2029982 RepID=A0A5S9QFS3_9GAMM|nr:Uncharacterised protein [BD1-7 clade bacterium]CAA0116274.1 Uncharacterised protein [BD1-7 clade bacterium]CAA0119940.1 Uncharacterised protein [BD1-7 clade bacterium]